MTDFASLPFGLNEEELDQALRHLISESRTMAAKAVVAAASELVMRIDYNKVSADMRKALSQILADRWDDADVNLCDSIASALVNFQHPVGRTLLEMKTSSADLEVAAIAKDALKEFGGDTH